MYTAKVAIEYGKITDGFFKAGLVPKEVGHGGGMIAFLPKGVALTGSVTSSPNEKADDQSDKTKERLWVGSHFMAPQTTVTSSIKSTNNFQAET